MLSQQNVTSLRTYDLIRMKQGGKEKWLMVDALVNYIAANSATISGSMSADVANLQNQINTINTAISSLATASSVTTLQSQVNSLASALSGYVTSSALSTALSSYATTTALATVAAAVAALQTAVTAIQTAIANHPNIYIGSTLLPAPKMYANKVNTTVTAGVATAVFPTIDGSGNPLFPNGVQDSTVNIFVNDSTALWPCSYVIAADKKSITVTLLKSSPTSVLTLLGIAVLGVPAAAPAGVPVRLTCWGN